MAEYLRADDVTVFDRKNRKTELSFDVKRQCASENDAAVWAVLLPVTATRSGTVTMNCTVSSVRLLTAVLETIRVAQVGATVFVSYRITGGKLEAV